MLGLEPLHDARGDEAARGRPPQVVGDLCDAAFEQLLVPLLRGQSAQHRGGGLRQIHLAQRRSERITQHFAHAVLLDEGERAHERIEQEAAEPVEVARIAQPLAHQRRGIVPADQRHQRLGLQEALVDEGGQVVGDAVLVARDHRRVVGDEGQAGADAVKEGMHREPVGQPAHERRLAERAQRAGELRGRTEGGVEGEGGRGDEEQAGAGLGAAEFGGAVAGGGRGHRILCGHGPRC